MFAGLGMGPSAARDTRMAPSIWAAPVIMFFTSRRDGAIHVGIVAVGGFVFDMGGVNRNAACLFFRRRVNLVVTLASPPNFFDNTVVIAAVNVVLP